MMEENREGVTICNPLIFLIEVKFMVENECELFKYTPKELVEAKLYTFQKMRLKQGVIINLKQLISLEENRLLLETDFKEKGLTNEKQRTAYINNELREKKRELEWLKYDYAKFTDDLALINDLLTIYKGD